MTRSQEGKIAKLRELDTSELRTLWNEVVGRPAPHQLSRDLLARAIAYEMQAKTEGGLRPALLRRLKRLAGNCRNSSNSTSRPVRALQPGVRLMREWNSETHVVDVLNEGVSWRGNRYRSLSAVAHAITGTHWSGPRFFGLARTASPPPQSSSPEQDPITARAVEKADV